jgi:hypothetical protein
LWQRLTARRWSIASAAAVLALAIVSAATLPSLLGDGETPLRYAGLSSDEQGADGPVAPAGARGAADGGSFETGDQSTANASIGDTVDADDSTFLTTKLYGLGVPPTVADTATPSPAATAQSQLETTGRSIISTTSLAIEVEAVAGALAQMRVIAESAGGFIETLSTSGGADPDQGNATIRVPGSAFFDSMTRIKALGQVTGEKVDSDDVTEEIIDLDARLRSEQAKEVRFIELLDGTTSVSEVLNVERELSRVRTEIERLQGQLSFIERRVSLATINVNFGKPGVSLADAPSASLAINTNHVDEAVTDVKRLAEQAGGEVDNTSVSLGGDGLQATVTLRVPPAQFESVVLQLQQLGDVRVKEVRQPGSNDDAPQSEDAVARIDITLSDPPGDDDRNWWLWAGAPLGGLAALALLLGGGRLAFVLGRRRGSLS